MYIIIIKFYIKEIGTVSSRYNFSFGQGHNAANTRCSIKIFYAGRTVANIWNAGGVIVIRKFFKTYIFIVAYTL